MAEDQIAEDTRTAPEQRPPVMLGIAGDSGAGKTTLACGITAALGADRSIALCVDNYHRFDRFERAAHGLTPVHPSCNYLEVMDQHLQLLALGQPLLHPVYDHRTGLLRRPVLVEPPDYVVVEGLHALHSKAARACFDVTVYLDPPEPVRRMLKVRRDTAERGYTRAEVDAELERREPDAAAFVRPQRRAADIVVRFAPIEERGESLQAALSATVLLRPTVPHPDLADILSPEHQKAIHLKLLRDEDGKPVDALHIHAYAPPGVTRQIQEAIWADLGTSEALPESLGETGDGRRSEPLAIVQLILLYHLLQAA